jgi:hypothetical protein
MHCVENLPAALSFSAICGSRLQRVENQRRDRQFSTIGLLWHVPCRGPRDRSVGERDGVRQIAATPHRGLDLRVAVRGASDGASMLEAGVGIIHSTDSAVDHCRQRTAARAPRNAVGDRWLGRLPQPSFVPGPASRVRPRR